MQVTVVKAKKMDRRLQPVTPRPEIAVQGSNISAEVQYGQEGKRKWRDDAEDGRE